jgi:hypothetical protein
MSVCVCVCVCTPVVILQTNGISSTIPDKNFYQLEADLVIYYRLFSLII